MKSLVTMALLGMLFVLTACGLPTNQLTAEERSADMNWVFTVFKHNYAPVELKKTNFGVEMSQVEADCSTLAAEDINNEAFLALFQKCIHTFKDAHVGGQQMNQGLLPEFAHVAHLGFVTMRTKTDVLGADGTSFEKVDALKIMSALKGADTESAPMLVGDLIVGVNGQSVSDYLNAEIVPYINVGQAETNLSLAAFRFGVRTSMDMALPEEEEIKLKVKREGTVFEITLPWITEDMLDFQLKQNPPKEGDGQGPGQSEAVPTTIEEALEKYKQNQFLSQSPLTQSFVGYSQLKELFSFLGNNPVDVVINRVKHIAMTGFKWVKFNPVLNSVLDQKEAHSSLGMRVFPRAKIVTDLMSNPMFKAQMITTENDRNYAYIQLSTFPADDKVLGEWFRAITAIQNKGIKSVIIDTIDNGGGSLIHGMRILNMVRQRSIDYPSIQARLNNNWMNSFKTQAAFGADDYAKTIGARMVRQFEEDMVAGKKLSRPFLVTKLDPFFLQNPKYGLDEDVKIALLVNEFCISMCDIFASVFQDNSLGQVIGQRTMGGGGNVVQHGVSPVAKLGLSITESLIISPKGKYLEDNGVTPDIYVDMVEDREKGFKKALEKALESTLGAPL